MSRWTWEQWSSVLRKYGAATVNMGDADTSAYVRERAAFLSKAAGSNKETSAHTLTLARAVGFSRSWCKSGFPTIEVGDKLFASLSCTSVPAEAMPDIGLPWRTFVVRIPERFQIEVDFGWGPGRQRIQYMDYEYVSDDGGNLGLRPLGLPGAGILRSFKTVGDLLTDTEMAGVDLDVAPWMSDAPDDACADIRKDITGFYRRAFVGVCIEMMSPRNAQAMARAAAHGVRYKRGEPRLWTFKVTRDVRVDCRDRLEEAIREVESGRKSTKLNVQVLVRGHWKRQRHGVGRAEVKFIHVEPYWRGPEDAPIALRSHVVKKPDDEGGSEAAE